MKKLSHALKIVFSFICLSPFILAAQQIDYKGLPQWSKHQEGITNYWLYTPDNLEPGKHYPIALFLHGCCPEDEVLRPRSTVDPPVRMWHSFGDNVQTIPTYIIAPVSKRGWTQHIDNLKKVMDDLVAFKQGDAQRIYITGFSMGGGGTWQFLDRYSDYFAAALPIGSGIRVDYEKVKDVPIWINIGENDRSAKALKDSVAHFRAKNGDERGALEWVTGVNPRYTEHDGIGHGVQWDAVSTQDLLSWAYEKINDGNSYPVIYFKSPEHKQTFNIKKQVVFDLFAKDNETEIKNIDVFLNGKLIYKLTQPPYKGTFYLKAGDNFLSATAYDLQGKSSTAKIQIKTNIQPKFPGSKLAAIRQGKFFQNQIRVQGNQKITFQLSSQSEPLPEGLTLSPEGELSGIPVVSGKYKFILAVTDAEGDRAEKSFVMTIKSKEKNDVIVKNVVTSSGRHYPALKFAKGSLPFSGKNSETNISDPAGHEGKTFIKTFHGDRDSTNSNFLSFDVDEDVILYLAYEKCDFLYESTIPEWLKEFKKQEGEQIKAQYFYFDVYSKFFPKGKITLPGAQASQNNVNNNYFVLIEKQ